MPKRTPKIQRRTPADEAELKMQRIKRRKALNSRAKSNARGRVRTRKSAVAKRAKARKRK